MADESISVVEFLKSFRDDVKEEFSEIKAELKNFVSKDYLTEALKSRDEKIVRLDLEIKQLELDIKQEKAQREQEKKQDRGLIKMAIYGAAGSFTVQIAVLIFATMMLRK